MRVTTSHLHGPILLVGHSGAGPLLSVIADAFTLDVAGLVFVDSFLPPSAGEFGLAAPGSCSICALATDRVLVPWSSWFGDDAMRELVPRERLRAALESEMPRLPLSYFQASVPTPEAWNRQRAPICC